MSKFNTTKVRTSKITTNKAGGQAYKESDKLELTSLVLTSMLNDKFYESGNDQIERLRNLLATVDPLFSAKLAVYARKEYGLRSVSHIMAAEIAHSVKGKEWTAPFLKAVVHRVDDITEILSYYISTYKKPIPNCLKKGLGKALAGFDAYSLSKYKSESKDVSLVDAVNILHPKPTIANKKAFKDLMTGKLKPAETWEVKLTQAGQEGKNPKEVAKLKEKVWKELIEEKKLGYFALLRNLRNILEQAPSLKKDVCKMLTNEELIKKSLIMPFRYQTAYDVISQLPNSTEMMDSVSEAMDIALNNVPTFDGKTLVVLDESGSMESIWFKASIFAAALVKANKADLVTFAGTARYQNVSTRAPIMDIAKSFSFECGSTNFHSIFPILKEKYDRIIILSDMQGWVGKCAPTESFKAYKKRTGANPKVFSFDLAGCGTLQFPEQSVYCLAGLSDKVFDIMYYLEDDKKAMIHEIEAVEF